MPSPDINNTPEQIEVPDQNSTADVVPTPSPQQAAEVLTSGTDNPQPQIEVKATNLIEVLNRLQNLSVENFFAVNPEDTNSIAEQRVYFKDALTIDVEADNLVTAFAKVYAMDRFQALDADALSEVYTIPLSTIANIDLRGKPQLHLYFIEVNYLSDSGRRIADGQIGGIRLMDKTSESLTLAELTTLGEKIRDLFKDYLWEKGKSMVSYSDPEMGYNLQILCQTKDGGIEVLTKVLSVRDHEIITKYVNFKENAVPLEAYPSTSTDIQILEKTYKTRRRRVEASVKLNVASLFIDGLQKPKVLYDRLGKYRSALVRDQ